MKRVALVVPLLAAFAFACGEGSNPTAPKVGPSSGPSPNHVPGTTTAQHVVAVRTSDALTNNVQIIWHADPGVAEYHIQVCTAEDCSDPTVVKNTTDAGSAWTEGSITSGHRSYTFTLAVPATRTTYYARVKSQGRNSDEPYKSYVSATFALGNGPPTAALSWDPDPADEGEAIEFDATASSDPEGETLTYAWNFGDGTTIAAGSNATPTHTYADNGTYSVSLTVKDTKGNSVTGSFDVDVDNVAPTATFARTPTGAISEHGTVALSLTAPVDPSSVDLAALRYAFDCGAGYGAAIDYATASATATASCPNVSKGPLTVKGKVFDKDGGATEYSETIAVGVVLPTATFNAPTPVNEGQAIALSLTDPSDPNVTYAFDCGSGTYGTASTTNSASCPTTDNGTVAVKGKIIDSDGDFTEYTANVTVDNVAPTVTGVTAPATIAEGNTINFSATGVTDPSTVDAAAGFTYAFACGAGGFGPFGANAGSCPAADGPATVTVRVKAKDKDGAESAEQTASVSVTNVAPTTTFGPFASVLEGSPIVLTTGLVVDPSSADAAAGFTVEFACGAAGTFSLSAVCPAMDGPATLPVRVRVRDKDGNFAVAGSYNEYASSVAVTNVAPVVNSLTLPSAPIKIGDAVVVSATFSDDWMPDGHTAVVHFDNTPVTGVIVGNTVTATTTSLPAGVYTVTVTVTDDNNESGTRSSALDAIAYVVVYDPSAGFVTGGGWIDSPSNACLLTTACTGATGKATFGFVSKYQKGATTPTGNTEFQFHAGNLNFKSTSYQWLVVGGARAQYKGVGTINGGGNYGFLITAIDAALPGAGTARDAFRIKIWDQNSGTVVYDNQMGAAETDDTRATELGGGSIVIHTK